MLSICCVDNTLADFPFAINSTLRNSRLQLAFVSVSGIKTDCRDATVQIPMGSGDALDIVSLSGDYVHSLYSALEALGHSDVIAQLKTAFPELNVYDVRQSATISLSTMVDLYLTADGLTGDAALSLCVGRKLKVSSHGCISNLFISSPDLKTAIEMVAKFYHLKAPFLEVALVEGAAQATIKVSFIQTLEPSLQKFIIGVLSGSALTILEFYGIDADQEFSLKLSPLHLQNADLYEKHLRLPPRKGACAFSLSFPRRYLSVPPPLANQELFEIAISSCSREYDSISGTKSFRQTVEEMIIADPIKPWLQQDLAAHFHMSVSTLRRSFAREGMQHQEVVNGAKMRVAQSLLTDSDIQITAISQKLGYSGSSNFASAFRRHAGVSPREFRARFIHK